MIYTREWDRFGQNKGIINHDKFCCFIMPIFLANVYAQNNFSKGIGSYRLGLVCFTDSTLKFEFCYS